MSDPRLLAASVLASLPAFPPTPPADAPEPEAMPVRSRRKVPSVKPKAPVAAPEMETPEAIARPEALERPEVGIVPEAWQGSGPVSGPQLFEQRWAALESGRLYTRLPEGSFRDRWLSARAQPTYEQWQHLLASEARAAASGRGNNRLSVVLGDSISLWLPHNGLPGDRLWLNQGISGDTTAGVARRATVVAETQADTVYVMAGINDLRQGSSNEAIVANLRQTIRQLRRQSPGTRVVLQSILPTRLPALSSDRIRDLNRELAAVARDEGAFYMDLQPYFADDSGNLRRELTTDGIHLSAKGYRIWQQAIDSSEQYLARLDRPVIGNSRL